MKKLRVLMFAGLVGFYTWALTQTRLGAASDPKPLSFHNCSVVNKTVNLTRLFGVSKFYKCDEGTVEIAGRSEMTIENGYVYSTELGEPDELSPPRLAQPVDYSDKEWCPRPTPSDPERKVLCGNKPRKCWDGKDSTWDPEWQGYSCNTPDHK